MPDALALTMLSPLALVPVILLALVRPGKRPGALPRLAELAALGAFAITLAGLAQTALGSPAGLAVLEAPVDTEAEALRSTVVDTEGCALVDGA